ncbi:hypothetical protein HMPREF1985_01014 [Mitsuokella sp. oral taxon 131 str. W9106]|nr:hypothetical protein HMPREF1985_01014 [Mitsuokella sp. oral taxon 131 str. W9106]
MPLRFAAASFSACFLPAILLDHAEHASCLSVSWMANRQKGNEARQNSSCANPGNPIQ